MLKAWICLAQRWASFSAASSSSLHRKIRDLPRQLYLPGDPIAGHTGKSRRLCLHKDQRKPLKQRRQKETVCPHRPGTSFRFPRKHTRSSISSPGRLLSQFCFLRSLSDKQKTKTDILLAGGSLHPPDQFQEKKSVIFLRRQPSYGTEKKSFSSAPSSRRTASRTSSEKRKSSTRMPLGIMTTRLPFPPVSPAPKPPSATLFCYPFWETSHWPLPPNR